MIRILITLIAFCGFAVSAQAGVIYNWQEIAPSTGGVSYNGQMEISEDAFFAGSAQVGTYGSPCSACALPATPSSSPVTTFSMDFAPTSITFAANTVFADLFTFEIYAFDISMNGSELLGSIYANDTGSDITMGSDAFGLWTISQSNTDAGGLCFRTGSLDCQGASGRWVLDQSTVPVPEPGALLLMLSMLGMLGYVRMQRTPATQKHSA